MVVDKRIQRVHNSLETIASKNQVSAILRFVFFSFFFTLHHFVITLRVVGTAIFFSSKMEILFCRVLRLMMMMMMMSNNRVYTLGVPFRFGRSPEEVRLHTAVTCYIHSRMLLTLDRDICYLCQPLLLQQVILVLIFNCLSWELRYNSTK